MQRRIADIKKDIAAHSARSAWDRGVKGYAVEMFDDYVDRLHIADDSVRIGKVVEADLLNGARDWEQYSYGGTPARTVSMSGWKTATPRITRTTALLAVNLWERRTE